MLIGRRSRHGFFWGCLFLLHFNSCPELFTDSNTSATATKRQQRQNRFMLHYCFLWVIQLRPHSETIPCVELDATANTFGNWSQESRFRGLGLPCCDLLLQWEMALTLGNQDAKGVRSDVDNSSLDPTFGQPMYWSKMRSNCRVDKPIAKVFGVENVLSVDFEISCCRLVSLDLL
jgi:hypothetical protein